jgi:hypothetical protein
MSKVQSIEQAVEQFSVQELAEFRDWFLEFDARAWDAQLERDVAAGKLDKLAEEALADLRTGRCTDL